MEEREQKQLLMDLDVVMRSNNCPYIVQFYGALFKEVSYLYVLEKNFGSRDINIVLLLIRLLKVPNSLAQLSQKWFYEVKQYLMKWTKKMALLKVL